MYTNLNKLSYYGAALSMAGMLFVTGCKKDDDNASNVTVSSIKSASTDLNGATPATNVGVGDDIVIVFSKNIDAATATSTNITLTPTGGTAAATTVTTSGATVTVNPTADLTAGTNYSLTIGNGVKASDGGAFTAKTVTFKTAGRAPVTAPQDGHQIGYWSFDNSSVNPIVGTLATTNTAATFGADRFGFANNAAVFNGTSSIIEVANGTTLISGPSHTMSIWAKVDTTNTHGHFLMGANFFQGNQIEVDTKAAWFKDAGAFRKSGSNSVDSLVFGDIFFNGEGAVSGTTTFNNNIGGANGVKGLLAAKWAHIVYTFDASSKKRTLYVNGVKECVVDFATATDQMKRVTSAGVNTTTPDFSTTFAFGFAKGRDAAFWEDPGTEFGQYSSPNANHFKGMLDDARFWDVALSEAEVLQLYNAEKP